ncbi:Uncharacterised protein [Mycobacteroides abscessus subsp. abscessus]|nr:Uncharacterised protein [Mycobacteroides abscessus subsp. abscessus]
MDTALPAFVTGEWLASLDGTASFAPILRAQLARPVADDGMQAWRRYWRLLAFDDRRRRRVLSLLDGWLQEADAALSVGIEDQEELKPVREFRSLVRDAINRVKNAGRDEALAWAGTRYAAWPKPARQTSQDLAIAMDLFRRRVISEEKMFRVLAACGLDPEANGPIPAEATERVLKIAADTEPDPDRSRRQQQGKITHSR